MNRGSHQGFATRRFAAVPGVVVASLIALAGAAGTAPIQFRVPIQRSLDYLPAATAAGDLNGDGKIDLVVSHYIEATLSVLLGDGQTNFAPAPSVPIGNGVIRIYIRDLNDDGDADLLVSHEESDDLTVVRGKGDGTFDPGEVIHPGHDPVGVAIADLDGDEILDLTVALSDEVGGMLAVMRGLGDLEYELVQTLRVANDAVEVVVGDFDGDELPDAATSNPADGTVSLLPGVSGGLFEVGDEIDAGPGATMLALADVDRDASADLIVGRTSDQMVSVLRGNGDGTFAAAESYPSGGRAFNQMVVVDVDDDGMVDVATLHLRSQSAAVLRGRADGTFANPAAFTAGVNPVNLAVADVNSDSRLDLISANEGVDAFAPSLSLLLAAAGGDFLAPRQLLDAADPAGAAVADFDSDAVADIAVGARQTRQVVIFPGMRGSTAASPIFVSLDREPEDLVAADFDHDGRSDFAVLTAGEVAVAFAAGGGSFEPAILTRLGSVSGRSLVGGDFDGDGDIDLAVSSPRAPFLIEMVRNDGNRSFAIAGSFDFGGPASGLAAADFDGDGRDEVAVSSTDGRIVLLEDVAGAFGESGAISTGMVPGALATGDVDGNAAADIVVVEPGARRLATFLNDGSGTFSPGQTPAITFASDVVLRDLNDDRFPDAVVSDPLTGELIVLQNDGSGGWIALGSVTVGERPSALAAGDFDDDGRYDLVATGATVSRPLNETGGTRPLRGDGNGDGGVTAADFTALTLELFDGDGVQVEAAAGGLFASGAGVDADGDGVVTTTEAPALLLRWTSSLPQSRPS